MIFPSMTTDFNHNQSFNLTYFDESGRLTDVDNYRFNLDLYNEKAKNGDFSFNYELVNSLLSDYELDGWGHKNYYN